MPTTLIKSRWSNGTLIFEDTSANELLLLASGAITLADKLVVTSGSIKPESGQLLHFAPAQTIDMADAQVVLSVDDANTQLTSNVLYVDANSGATEDLLLPPEADSDGLMLLIANTGGESIVVKEDGDSTTIITIATAEVGIVWCDGTTWRGGMMLTTSA